MTASIYERIPVIELGLKGLANQTELDTTSSWGNGLLCSAVLDAVQTRYRNPNIKTYEFDDRVVNEIMLEAAGKTLAPAVIERMKIDAKWVTDRHRVVKNRMSNSAAEMKKKIESYCTSGSRYQDLANDIFQRSDAYYLVKHQRVLWFKYCFQYEGVADPSGLIFMTTDTTKKWVQRVLLGWNTFASGKTPAQLNCLVANLNTRKKKPQQVLTASLHTAGVEIVGNKTTGYPLQGQPSSSGITGYSSQRQQNNSEAFISSQTRDLTLTGMQMKNLDLFGAIENFNNLNSQAQVLDQLQLQADSIPESSAVWMQIS
ncbi:hypothetical protein HK098_006517 [Nowakowskiella sp. JEL0407]|nr:hypothetical protein HK098_006517 [Nowakowskiella sp. JEL0407]